MKGGKALAWGLAAVACAAIPAILLLDAGVGEYSQSWVANVVGPVAILTSVAVGLVLALKRPSNPIGWLLLANGLIFGWLGGFPASTRDTPSNIRHPSRWTAAGSMGHRGVAAAVRRRRGDRFHLPGRPPPVPAVATRSRSAVPWRQW